MNSGLRAIAECMGAVSSGTDGGQFEEVRRVTIVLHVHNHQCRRFFIEPPSQANLYGVQLMKIITKDRLQMRKFAMKEYPLSNINPLPKFTTVPRSRGN